MQYLRSARDHEMVGGDASGADVRVLRLPQEERGFSLVEILIAFLLLQIVLFMLMDTVVLSMQDNIHNKMRDVAVLATQDVLYNLRALPIDATPELDAGTTTTTVQRAIGDQRYLYTITVTITWDIPTTPNFKGIQARTTWVLDRDGDPTTPADDIRQRGEVTSSVVVRR